MDARAEREAQVTAGDLQSAHRVSAATPKSTATIEEVSIAICTVLTAVLDELQRMNVALERLADK